MTREQVDKIVEELGLIDLGDAILYLDEAGQIEAVFSTSIQPDACIEQCIA